MGFASAGGHEVGDCAQAAIMDGEREAGFQQVAGHGLAHEAEADETEIHCFHNSTLLMFITWL